jgi:uncharacterized NAD-dependent epimerase/dehydratase family protein
MYLDALPAERRILILAEGRFGHMTSKTANAVLRYQPETVVGVVDSRYAGETAQRVIGCGGSVPVVASIDEGLALQPNILLIGIAPGGGVLPESWLPLLTRVIENGVHIVGGLHTFVSEIPELSAAARRQGTAIIDLRKVPDTYKRVAAGAWENRKAKTILTVGTDCNIGKMTATMELHLDLRRRGRNSVFVATGQTGIFLAGSGVAVDSVVGDFIAGSIEKEIEDSLSEDTEYVLVEGQGALTHQGYSGVTMGLIHGSMPDAMILCHMAGRTVDQDYRRPFPDLKSIIGLHESVVDVFKPSKVAGIAVNSVGLAEAEAMDFIRGCEAETGLPATDPYRFGAGKLTETLL